MNRDESDALTQETRPGHPADWQRYAGQLRAARERLQNLNIDDPAIPACIDGLTRIEEMLRRPLRLVVLGEYNSGKTSVTGLILGHGLLPVSVLSNTGMPVHVGHGLEPALYGINHDGIAIRIDGAGDDALTDLAYRAVDIRLPLPWLQHHHVLDTPATLTPAIFTPDADIAIWCTVATRAWTESERNLWSTMPPRLRKTAIMVATHKDSFYSDEDCDQVVRRLQSMTAGLFRETVLLSAAPPEDADLAPAGPEHHAGILHAAIDASGHIIRRRRLEKAKRIVARLARLALHEFGRNAIRPETADLFARWQVLTTRALDEHREKHLPVDQTLRALLHAFSMAAETLQPGVIRTAARTAEPPAETGPNPSATPASPVTLRADLTAVLRILASTSRYESPQTREQREAARATLLALSDLDTVFAQLSTWLTTTNARSEPPTWIANA